MLPACFILVCNVAQAAFCCTHGKDGKSAREVLDLINCRFSVHRIFVPTAGFALPEISVSINLIVFNRLNEKICVSQALRCVCWSGAAVPAQLMLTSPEPWTQTRLCRACTSSASCSFAGVFPHQGLTCVPYKWWRSVAAGGRCFSASFSPCIHVQLRTHIPSSLIKRDAVIKKRLY